MHHKHAIGLTTYTSPFLVRQRVHGLSLPSYRGTWCDQLEDSPKHCGRNQPLQYHMPGNSRQDRSSRSPIRGATRRATC